MIPLRSRNCRARLLRSAAFYGDIGGGDGNSHIYRAVDCFLDERRRRQTLAVPHAASKSIGTNQLRGRSTHAACFRLPASRLINWENDAQLNSSQQLFFTSLHPLTDSRFSIMINSSFSSSRRRMLISLGYSAGLLALPTLAQQPRRIRLVVPTSAGGATDAAARALQPGLSAALGMPVVVENLPGAAGVIGLQSLHRPVAGEISLVVITNSLAILPSTMKSFPFDVMKDFTPVAMLANIPMALASNPLLGTKNVQELIASIKGSSKGLNFGSSGTGSISHLTTELFLQEAGNLKVSHIPFQGPAPMTTALLGNQIDFASQGLPVFHPYFKSGSLRPIGVFSGKRSVASPEIPTLAEQGLPGASIEAWVSLIGPKAMDTSLVRSLHEAAAKAYNDPETKQRLAQQGTEVAVSGPEEARMVIAKDLERFAALTKKIGVERQ